uniref:MKKS centrosomal shuttling protein n=1 Tax=Podarcis muralis TaxID=64176 RepID=A0A670HSC3_PODMU|nr:McKusick-Kaufman/Bardet-Biedl syndromes putative chaperonin isoform X2 [Podarcis muralis]
MSRLDAKKSSLCTSEPLTKEAISCVLSVFSEIVKSCYGPTGRFKQLHNGMGGYVRTTSQSFTLLAGLCVTHPVLKLLTASVQSHLSLFGDCGLFTAILCCSLLEKIRALNVAPCTSIKICQHLLSLCTDYLSSEACGCRVPVDFGSSKIPLGLVRSVLTSKRACMLSRNEVDHISTLVLKAFVLTISPQNTETSVAFGKCLYIPVKDRRAMDSAVYPGLLIETPDLDLTTELPVRTAPSCAIKMALFSLSLSGDLSDTGEGTIFVHQRVFLQAEVLGQLLNLGRQMVDDGVSLVVCQKVIHPALKQYLKEKQVVAVERVGAAMMEPLKQITGSQPMPSLQFLSPACYGRLKDLRAESFASKRFLHLIPDDPVVCSLVLCSRNETAWEELRSCAVTRSTLENLSCSRAEFQLVADSFCGSLESVSRCLEHDGGDVLTDTKWGHFWSVPPDLPSGSNWSDVVQRCGCGLCGPQQGLDWKILQCRSRPFPPQSCVGDSSVTSTNNPVLDCFAAKRNGLQVAVETASLLLDLSYIVEDRN